MKWKSAQQRMLRYSNPSPCRIRWKWQHCAIPFDSIRVAANETIIISLVFQIEDFFGISCQFRFIASAWNPYSQQTPLSASHNKSNDEYIQSAITHVPGNKYIHYHNARIMLYVMDANTFSTTWSVLNFLRSYFLLLPSFVCRLGLCKAPAIHGERASLISPRCCDVRWHCFKVFCKLKRSNCHIKWNIDP